jgi:hypothetical protein
MLLGARALLSHALSVFIASMQGNSLLALRLANKLGMVE